MRFSRTILGLCAFMAYQSSAQATVLDTAHFNGHTYHLLSGQDWQSAENESVSLGGHLVTINDLAEHNFIWSLSGAGTAQNAGQIWIGFNDIAVEGSFVWTSGETPGYTNWASGEPNNLGGNEDAVHMRSVYPNGEWNDVPISLLQFGVAEVVPVPAALPFLAGGIAVMGLMSWRRKRAAA